MQVLIRISIKAEKLNSSIIILEKYVHLLKRLLLYHVGYLGCCADAASHLVGITKSIGALSAIADEDHPERRWK